MFTLHHLLSERYLIVMHSVEMKVLTLSSEQVIHFSSNISTGDTLQLSGGVCSDVMRRFLNYGSITLMSCCQCHSRKLTSAVVTVKCRLASYELWDLKQVANISKCPFSEYNPASCRVVIRTE